MLSTYDCESVSAVVHGVINHADFSHVVRCSVVFVSVRLCIFMFFYTTSQKAIQLGSPNLTQAWSTMSPGNPFRPILGSKVKGQLVKVTRHKNIAGVGHGTFVSAGFF